MSESYAPLATMVGGMKIGGDASLLWLVRGRIARIRGNAGAAVLIYSSDLDEVLALAHRVLVAARGSLLEAPPGATRAQVGELMVTGGR